MFPPHIYNLISVPIISGIVGYITNKVAIKMLFRPYYPKWYTLGWQGIVPRSRTKLASLIGNMISQKLLSPDDISSSIIKNGFKDNVAYYIGNKLSNTSSLAVEDLLTSSGVENIFEKNSLQIDKFANLCIFKIIDKYLDNKFPIEKITDLLRENIENDNSVLSLSEKISDIIKEKLSSDEKLSETLPSSILNSKNKINEALTEKTSDIIKNMGLSIAVKEAVAAKLVSFKNKFFAGNGTMDMLKMGFINMVLNDETISNTVKRELPSIMEGIAEDKNIKLKISEKIGEEIDNFLNSSISDITNKISTQHGISVNNEIAGIFSSDKTKKFIKNSLSSVISSYESKYSGFTIRDALNTFGFDIKKLLENFSLSKVINENKSTIKNTISCKGAEYISKNAHALGAKIAEKSESLFKEAFPTIMKNANIATTVENKINDMPLEDVEKVLFSFMNDHFKWINRLGFILGFIIGIIQAAIVYFVK